MNPQSETNYKMKGVALKLIPHIRIQISEI